MTEFKQKLLYAAVDKCQITRQPVAARSRHAVLAMLQGGAIMSFFSFLKQPDINQSVTDFRNTREAVLLDVRTAQEYREGHIPGSTNVPLQQLDKIISVVENKDTVLYVYCHSGARSRQAVSILQHMGYNNATNIGGIAGYRGKVESI